MSIKIKRQMLPAEYRDTRTLVCDACGREETPIYADTLSISACSFCGAMYCDRERNTWASSLCAYPWVRYEGYLRVCEKCNKLQRVVLLLDQHRRASERLEKARQAYNKTNDRLIALVDAVRKKREDAAQVEAIPAPASAPAPESESESESEE